MFRSTRYASQSHPSTIPTEHFNKSMALLCPRGPAPPQVGPCLALAFFVHPKTEHWFIFKCLWAACVYLESISVLPQL